MRLKFPFVIMILLLIFLLAFFKLVAPITVQNTKNIKATRKVTLAENIPLKVTPIVTNRADNADIQKEQINALVLQPYKGPIEHIFFHPLIAYPELAFDNDSMSLGYNDWFVTVNEFNKILKSLYTDNFILIDTNSLLNYNNEKALMLPPGKKPLIISVDDLNYYDYMIKNGNVFKLILDSSGNIATYSINPKGETVVSKNNELIPIIDEFVKAHEDFSLKGAKGLIALTGYQGILGYRTNNLDSPNYAEDKKNVEAVISRLKQTGWSFACHGFGHLDADKINLETLERDTTRWRTEVEPLIGTTCIYVYPFGSSVAPGTPKFEYLATSGFKIFCAVGPTSYLQSTPNYILMDRRHIDGISLHSQRKSLLDLFDSNEIIDSIRPNQY